MGTKISKKVNISAGLVILMNHRILLVQQSYDVNGNYLSIPKGAIKKSETAMDAAIRETFEETGIRIHSEDIQKEPHIINVNNEVHQKRIIYYIVQLYVDNVPEIRIQDTKEIKWAGFVTYQQAIKSLQPLQYSILFHMNNRRIEPNTLLYLLDNDYITREKHSENDFYIYNYTKKCKIEEYWNEITLWCRGIILDRYYNIIAYPLKKFFEYSQLYYPMQSFIDNRSYRVYEKKDGFLGILYWVNGLPFIATRNSFVSKQAVKANSILYGKYHYAIAKLNPNYSYFFEIVYPNDYLVVTYGLIEDIFLIGAHDNIECKSIPIEEIEDLPFPKVECTPILLLSELLSLDINGEEGYVLLYDNGFRIKIKFPSFKEKYILKHHEDTEDTIYNC